MAENKQYVNQKLENGSMLISEDVIATIIANAIAEVDGVVGLCVKPGAEFADKFGRKSWANGIKITVDKGNDLYIDCNVNIGYGQNVVTIANTVQNSICAALESVAGVKVAAVNVNVGGIIRQ